MLDVKRCTKDFCRSLSNWNEVAWAYLCGKEAWRYICITHVHGLGSYPGPTFWKAAFQINRVGNNFRFITSTRSCPLELFACTEFVCGYSVNLRLSLLVEASSFSTRLYIDLVKRSVERDYTRKALLSMCNQDGVWNETLCHHFVKKNKRLIVR